MTEQAVDRPGKAVNLWESAVELTWNNIIGLFDCDDAATAT